MQPFTEDIKFSCQIHLAIGKEMDSSSWHKMVHSSGCWNNMMIDREPARLENGIRVHYNGWNRYWWQVVLLEYGKDQLNIQESGKLKADIYVDLNKYLHIRICHKLFLNARPWFNRTQFLWFHNKKLNGDWGERYGQWLNTLSYVP